MLFQVWGYDVVDQMDVSEGDFNLRALCVLVAHVEGGYSGINISLDFCLSFVSVRRIPGGSCCWRLLFVSTYYVLVSPHQNLCP